MTDTLTAPQIAAAVYQACTTYDQYLPQLAPEVARSWSKVFKHSELSIDDLLAGVDRVYLENGAGYRPLPADIARAGRAIRQDRTEREPDELRESRQQRQESLAASEEVKSIATVLPMGPTRTTRRLHDALSALENCNGKHQCSEAIKEFLAAKAEARRVGKQPRATNSAKIAAARQALDGEQAKS